MLILSPIQKIQTSPKTRWLFIYETVIRHNISSELLHKKPFAHVPSYCQIAWTNARIPAYYGIYGSIRT